MAEKNQEHRQGEKQNQSKKSGMECLLAYLKSRRWAFLRLILFAMLAFVFYKIGKIWEESFFVTLRFFYPLSVMAALSQILCFLPKWEFLKPVVKKLLKKAGGRMVPFFRKIGKAFTGLWNGFFRFRHRFWKNADKKNVRRKNNTAYRDELLYAEGNGFSGRRRHHLKWRDMKTNQDKVRFYYMRYVYGAVRKGAPFGYHFTPDELKRLWKNPEGSQLVMGLYYQARYGGADILEKEIEDLEEYFHK